MPHADVVILCEELDKLPDASEECRRFAADVRKAIQANHSKANIKLRFKGPFAAKLVGLGLAYVIS